MLQLTPLEKTVAGQEVFQMGRKEGLIEGMEEGMEKGEKQGIRKGEVIGEIRLAQRLLKCPVDSLEILSEKSLPDLEILLRQLELELDSRQ